MVRYHPFRGGPRAQTAQHVVVGAGFLPGGEAVLFTALSGGRETATIVVHSLKTGERHVLLNGTYPRYIPTGHLVFARSNALWAAPFDADILRVTGEPIPVVDGVRQEPFGAAQLEVADDGTLVYLPTRSENQRALAWVDRTGAVTPLTTELRNYRSLSMSPNGEELVLGITGDDGRDNLWLLDVERSTLTPLTSDHKLNRSPVWAPDGKRIAFLSAAKLGRDVAIKVLPQEMASDSSRLRRFEQEMATTKLPEAFAKGWKRPSPF